MRGCYDIIKDTIYDSLVDGWDVAVDTGPVAHDVLRALTAENYVISKTTRRVELAERKYEMLLDAYKDLRKITEQRTLVSRIKRAWNYMRGRGH